LCIFEFGESRPCNDYGGTLHKTYAMALRRRKSGYIYGFKKQLRGIEKGI
jgi:hypothetical protein